MADQPEISLPSGITLDPATAEATMRYAVKAATDVTLYHATRQEKINDWVLAFSTAILVALFMGKSSLDVAASKILAGLVLLSFFPGIWAKLLYLQPVPNAMVSAATKEAFNSYLKEHPSGFVTIFPQVEKYMAWYMTVLVDQKQPFLVRLLLGEELPKAQKLDDKAHTQELVKTLGLKIALVKAQYLLVFLGVIFYGLLFIFS